MRFNRHQRRVQFMRRKECGIFHVVSLSRRLQPEGNTLYNGILYFCIFVFLYINWVTLLKLSKTVFIALSIHLNHFIMLSHILESLLLLLR